jgi:hypothetical protein
MYTKKLEIGCIYHYCYVTYKNPGILYLDISQNIDSKIKILCIYLVLKYASFFKSIFYGRLSKQMTLVQSCLKPILLIPLICFDRLQRKSYAACFFKFPYSC